MMNPRWEDGSLALARLAGVIRLADRFNTPSRANFAMRGFAISFLTLDFGVAAIHVSLEEQPPFAAHTSILASGVASGRPCQNEISD